jgi:hypothetical protein
LQVWIEVDGVEDAELKFLGDDTPVEGVDFETDFVGRMSRRSGSRPR